MGDNVVLEVTITAVRRTHVLKAPRANEQTAIDIGGSKQSGIDRYFFVLYFQLFVCVAACKRRMEPQKRTERTLWFLVSPCLSCFVPVKFLSGNL